MMYNKDLTDRTWYWLFIDSEDLELNETVFLRELFSTYVLYRLDLNEWHPDDAKLNKKLRKATRILLRSFMLNNQQEKFNKLDNLAKKHGINEAMKMVLKV